MTAPSAVDCAIERFAAEVSSWSAFGLNRVDIDRSILFRGPLADQPAAPRTTSHNGSCRLIRTRDLWIAINLPRPEDVDMVPALVGRDLHADPWAEIEAHCRDLDASVVLATAHLLGIAASALGEKCGIDGGVFGEVASDTGLGTGSPWKRRPQVVDLSALWAGPLCAALLAQAGCDVVKIESKSRPDWPGNLHRAHFDHLNCGKRRWSVDFESPNDRARLIDRLDTADVIISSARRRGLDSLGISPETCREHNPAAIWIAITGHGLDGIHANRIGFGDDCAVAGGLAAVDQAGIPGFVHDAVADPLTGIRAAAIALRALAVRGGLTADVSLSATAAIVSSMIEDAND